MAQAVGGQPTTLLTLTTNPHHLESPHERAVELSHAWRRLRRAIMKRQKLDALPFIAVFERTKQGEPHLHILLRAPFISQRWISAWLDAEIGAPICDIRRIRGRKAAAAYIAKYIGKDPQRFTGTKRYWSSTDYDQRAPYERPEGRPEPRSIFVVQQRLEEYCRDLEAQGMWITRYEGGAMIQTLEDAFRRRP